MPYPLPSRVSRLPEHSSNIDLYLLAPRPDWFSTLKTPQVMLQVLYFVVHCADLAQFASQFAHDKAWRDQCLADKRQIEDTFAAQWVAIETQCRVDLKTKLLQLYDAQPSDMDQVSQLVQASAADVAKRRRLHQDALAREIAALGLTEDMDVDPYLRIGEYLKANLVELLLVARGIGADDVAHALLAIVHVDPARWRTRKEWHSQLLEHDARKLYVAAVPQQSLTGLQSRKASTEVHSESAVALPSQDREYDSEELESGEQDDLADDQLRAEDAVASHHQSNDNAESGSVVDLQSSVEAHSSGEAEPRPENHTSSMPGDRQSSPSAQHDVTNMRDSPPEDVHDRVSALLSRIKARKLTAT
jgi:hypothetical protein